MTGEQNKRLQDLLDHLDEFWTAAMRLGKKLINDGRIHVGRLLMANARLHDHSKFFGVEWDCLVMGLQSYTGNFVQNLSPDSRVLDILRDAFKSGFDAGYVAGVKSVGREHRDSDDEMRACR